MAEKVVLIEVIDTKNDAFKLLKWETCGDTLEQRLNTRSACVLCRTSAVNKFTEGEVIEGYDVVVHNSETPFYEGQEPFEKTGMYYKNELVKL